jgi:hypothetical protein
MDLNPPIVLFSFRRPSLTISALERIVKSGYIGSTTVSIDGIAPWTTKSDIELRNQTISKVERFCSENSGFQLKVWDGGEGLNSHAIRIFDLLFESNSAVISLEEDNYIDAAGFEFLATGVSSKLPRLVTAYSSTTHPTKERGYRETAFPELWATALNGPQYETFKRVVHERTISESVIDWAVSSSIKESGLQVVARRYWTMLMRRAIANHSRGDALMQYAAWVENSLILAPWQPLVKDLGRLDSLGLNRRAGDPNRPRLHARKSQIGASESVCLRCERSDIIRRLKRAPKAALKSSFQTR